MKSLLIIKLSALGDVVMTLPALNALRARYPGAAIHWLVEEAASAILPARAGLDKVIVWPRRSLTALLRRKRFLEVWRLGRAFLAELRAEEYEVALDLQGLFKSGFWLSRARARRKVGFAAAREGAWWFADEVMPGYDPERHAVRRYLDAAVHLGAEYPDPEPASYLRPAAAAEAEARTLLGPAAAGYVVLNPGAKWETKRWPLEHWLTLAGYLRNRRLVVTGGPEDAPLGAALAAAGAVNLCGRTGLETLAAVLCGADLVITADTGPMHLAAAAGARGLALFGPTRPGRTGPFGGRFQVITAALPCLGCLQRRCGNSRCMSAISPRTVFEAALNLML